MGGLRERYAARKLNSDVQPSRVAHDEWNLHVRIITLYLGLHSIRASSTCTYLWKHKYMYKPPGNKVLIYDTLIGLPTPFRLAHPEHSKHQPCSLLLHKVRERPNPLKSVEQKGSTRVCTISKMLHDDVKWLWLLPLVYIFWISFCNQETTNDFFFLLFLKTKSSRFSIHNDMYRLIHTWPSYC